MHPHTQRDRRHRLLLAGINPELKNEVRENLGNVADIISVEVDDTLSHDILKTVDIALVDLDAAESLAYRFANLIGEENDHCQVLAIGENTISETLREHLPAMRRVSLPINYDYIRGLLDSVQVSWRRMLLFDEEQVRVKALYEISSALLKVTNRNHIAPALENTLPMLLDTHLILLVFPPAPNPVFFLHSPQGFSPPLITAIRAHLKEAWEVLRSDFDVAWDWLPAPNRPVDEQIDRNIKPTSFITTPISSGNRTEGFLTVLPRSEKSLNETFLQTFFVIGDLISVLLHNLELRERLEERAMHDGLTRLLNRQTLIEHLEKECRRSQRHEQPISVVMMDIDYFKQINDHYGHQAGDEVLRVIARRLRNSIRDMDIVGRCGGEEFIIVLVNTELEGGEIWAERFRKSLAEDLITYLDKKINITASFGVDMACGDEAIVDRLIARADKALYEAKRRGRNMVVTTNTLPPSTTPVPAPKP